MRIITRLASLLLVASAFGLTQEKLDPFALERLLSPGALFYLSVPQSPAASEDYATSAVKRFWENGEIRSFKAPFEAWWAKRKTQGVQLPGRPASPSFNDIVRAEIGLSIDDLWQAFSGPLSAAVYDVPLGGTHGLDLVLALGAPDFAVLQRLAGQAKDVLKRGGLQDGQFAHEGKTLYELGNAQFKFYYAFLENHLILTTLQPRLEQIVTASVKKQGPALRDAADFKGARARISADNRHLFHFHANTAAIFKSFRKEIGDEGLKVMEALGVADVQSVDVGLGYDGGFLRERYSLRTSRQDRGFLKYLAGGTPKDPLAAKVPAGAVVYTHAAVDLAALYDAVAAAAKASPEFEEMFVEGLKEFETEVGLNVREALGSLGTSWTGWSVYPEGGGLLPYDLAAVELRDPAVFAKAVEKLTKAFKRPVERMTFRGRTIEHLTIPLFPGMEEMGPDPMTWMFSMAYPLSWTIEGKTLYVSLNPLSIKRHILRGEAPKTTIAQDPRWAALAARVPADAWESWMYADLGRVLGSFYNTFEPFLHFARDLPRDWETGELIVDLAQLPMGETLSDLLGPTFTHKRTLPDGLLVESWSNLGVSYSAFFYVGVAAGVTMPLLMRQKMMAAEPAGPAANELIAQLSLQLIRQAQETFKNSDSDRNNAADYWTRDLAGLYGLKDGSGQAVFLIDPQTAQADPDGAARYGLAPAPKNGYFYKAMTTDPDGQPYQADADKDGNAYTNKARYGVAAWPAQYGAGGRLTFILGESGKVWKKDTQGRPVDRWPGKDPAEEGWEPAD
ncbi:MAG TPA: DUF2950 family protein [Planctomycetota bacterium]